MNFKTAAIMILFSFSCFSAVSVFGCSTVGGGISADRYDNLPSAGDPLQTGMLVTQHLLNTKMRIGPNGMHYSEVCAGYGALKYAALIKNKELTSKIIARYENILTDAESRKIIPVRDHVDDFVFGVLPLEIYMQNKDSRYLKLGLDFADRQWENPLPGGLTRQTRWWIDDMYMVSSLQIQAYRATGDIKYADRAVLFLSSYLDKLQQENGLFRHGNASPFYWSRGNGWVAASLAEILSSIPAQHKGRERLMNGYLKMIDSLLLFQSDSGLWKQVIDKKNFWDETSGTAMFTFAIRTGLSKGWIKGDTYESSARRGYIGLINNLTPSGVLKNVCEGTSQINDEVYYYARKRIDGDLHGQAPFLWMVNSIIENRTADKDSKQKK